MHMTSLTASSVKCRDLETMVGEDEGEVTMGSLTLILLICNIGHRIASHTVAQSTVPMFCCFEEMSLQ